MSMHAESNTTGAGGNTPWTAEELRERLPPEAIEALEEGEAEDGDGDYDSNADFMAIGRAVGAIVDGLEKWSAANVALALSGFPAYRRLAAARLDPRGYIQRTSRNIKESRKARRPNGDGGGAGETAAGPETVSGYGPTAASAYAPEPLDMFGDVALAGQPDLPEDLLPAVVGDYARDNAERLGVDLGTVALPCLAVLAAATPDAWRIRPMRLNIGWTESARLWGALVGDVGIAKSPAIDAAIAPLRAIERELHEEDAEGRKAYALAKAIHDERRKAYVRARAKPKGDGGHPPEEPTKPRTRRILAGDTTIEALSEILVDNPGGVLVHRDELVGLFASFDMYRDRGGSDRAHWLALFQGGLHLIDRIRRGRIQVPNWSACVLGGIQPEAMRRIVDRLRLDEDGLLQRFIVVNGRRVGPALDRAPDAEAALRYARTMRALFASRPPDGAVVTLHPDAHDFRTAVDHVAGAMARLPTTSAALRGHTNKWPAIYARLLLLFHMVEAGGDERRALEPVPAELAERVARMMTAYLLPHAARFYGEMVGVSEEQAHARGVAGAILAAGPDLTEVSRRWVYRAHRPLEGQPALVDTVLEALSVAGWVDRIEPEEGQRGRGRPTERWSVNPAVHRLFTARAEAERARRADAREQALAAMRDLGLSGETRH